MLYFYPKEYQKKAVARGLADEKTLRKKCLAFMIPFTAILLAALVLIIAVWNRAGDFRTAYPQALLFLEVMNWFDGLLDRAWIGHSRIWIIPEMEGEPFVSSWRQILRKRLVGTVLFAVVAVPVAGLAVLVGRLL